MSQTEAKSEVKSLDRRSRRTRRLLKEALFSLILEKGYDAVTIEDITGRADLGRTTFYLHYKDKEELLLEAINNIADDLIGRLPPSAFRMAEAPGSFVKDAILITFQHAAENAQLYRIILRGEGATRAHGLIHKIIVQRATLLVQERQQAGELNMQIPLDVFVNYFAGALLATITWWLEADMPYPPEDIARMFRVLVFEGGRRALGME